MFLVIPGWIKPEFRCLVRFLIFLALIGLSFAQRPGVGVQQPQSQFPQQPPQFQQAQPQFPQQQSQFQQPQPQFPSQPQPQAPLQRQFQQPRFIPPSTGAGPVPPLSPQFPQNATLPFQLSSNINLARTGTSQLSRAQIWFAAAQVLATVNEQSRPDYVLTLQPPSLQKGIPAQNISQILFTGSTLPNADVLKTLIEHSSGMLVSQQAVIIQRIRMRLGEPLIVRTILSTESPFELFRFFNPPLLAKNMGTIIKTIKETPDISRMGLKAVQVKLLPTNLLSAWLTWVRTTSNVPRLTAEDLSGKSFFGAAQQLNLAIMGLGCRELGMVPAPEILSVLARYRQELYELRRQRKSLAFPLNLRNCALSKVVEFLKARNATASGNQVNILNGLRPGEVSAIGGEILTAVPAAALENIPLEIRQEILQEVGRLEILDLFRMARIDQLQWYANKFLSDLTTVRQPARGPIPQLTDTLSPVQGPSVPLDASALQRLGNLLCYGNKIGNVSQVILREVLDTRTGEGMKTCCLDSDKQLQWASLLKQTYGQDTSKWLAADLVGAGDLLISLSDEDLRQISTDALGKSVSQILRQSGFITPLDMIEHVRPVPFIAACMERLGSDGQHFLTSYKSLMRKLVEASQWMVNSVKTLDQVISDGAGRPRPRVQRAAEPIPAYPAQPQVVPYWRLLRSPAPVSPLHHAYHSRIRRQAPAPLGPVVMSAMPNFPRPTPTTQGQAPGQPIGSVPPGMRLITGQRQRNQPSVVQPQQVSFRPPLAALPVRPTGFNPNLMRPAPNVQQTRAPPSSPIPAPRPAPSVQALVQQFQAMQSMQVPAQQQQLPIRTGPNPVMQNQNRPVTSPMLPPPTQITQNQNPGFQNPGIQNQNLGFQSFQGVTPQNQNSGVSGFQNPNAGFNPAIQNPTGVNSMFQNQNSGVNPGFQNPNAGVNPGFQNPNTGFVQPGVQNQNPGFQNPNTAGFSNPGFPNPSVQSQNFTGFPPNQQQQQQQGGRQPVPSAPQFQNFQTRSQPPEGTNVNGSQPNANGNDTSVSGATNEKTRSLPADSSSQNLTCMGIKASGPAAIGLTQEDFDNLAAEEIFDCIETFGNIDWEEGRKRSILKLYKEKLNLTNNRLDTLNLIELGTLVTAFSSTDKKAGISIFDDLQSIVESPQEKENAVSKNAFDISALDLKLPNSLDTLSLMGIFVTEPETLKALADKFSEDNQNFPGAGRPDSLRVTVWSLGNILCGFQETKVQTIFEADRSLFIDVSPMLGRLQGCNFETLTTLAQFSVLPSNYGPPQQWTREDVSTIGVVMAGLSPELFATLTPDALEGLQPSAVRVIPTASLQSLSLEQLANISFDAASSIQTPNVEVLTHDQNAVLNKVLTVEGDDFNIPPVSSTVLAIPSPDKDLETRALDSGNSDATPSDSVSGRIQTPSQSQDQPADVPIFIPDQDNPSLGGVSDVITDEMTRSLNTSDPHSAHGTPGTTTTPSPSTTTTAVPSTATTVAPSTTEPPKMDEPAKETSSATYISSSLICLVIVLPLYLIQL